MKLGARMTQQSTCACNSLHHSVYDLLTNGHGSNLLGVSRGEHGA